MKKQFQNWAWSQGMKFNSKVHDLTYFFWETTLRCNLKCRHCGSDCDKDKSAEDLPKEKVIQVFRNIAESYEPKDIMVAVTGGEPLVRKDLFEILSEVSSMGFPWGMVTNGMLVDEKMVERCAESGMRTVSVSLDGLREAHNWLRNSDVSYDRAVNALRLFLKSGKFKVVEAITCVNAQNINQLEDIYKLLKDAEVHGWRLFTIFPKGRAETNSELLLNKTLVTELLNFIRDKRISSPGMHISYSEEGYLGCNWEKEVRDDFFFCSAGVNVGSLLADGSYSACPSLSSEWIQGHVDEVSFTEAWETRYKNMRDRKWMRTDGCKACRQWNKCNGSSLHLWDFKEGKTKVCHYNMLNECI